MSGKQDIQSRQDIELLIDSFYEKVKKDDLISFFFTDVVPVDWPKHLPAIYSFWEMVVLGTGNYRGDPMTVHQKIHEKQKLEHRHFERWVLLFTSTADELFAGPRTEQLKQRARSIAQLMEHKMM